MKLKIFAAALLLGGCQATGETVTAKSEVAAPASSAFVGTWRSDWGGAIDTTLTVRNVSGNSANVTYTWKGSSYGPGGTANPSARVNGNVLSWTSYGTSFRFVARGNTLSATRTTTGGSRSTTFRKVN